jgi:predicted O-methyltransferase YrrM
VDVNTVSFAEISTAALIGKSFIFGRVDGSSIGRVTLAADGSISGYQNPNEHAWSVRDGKLIFSSIEGASTTVFTLIPADDGSYAFQGAFLPMGPGLWHTLREIGQPPPRIIEEIGKELYGSDMPLAYADPRFRDDGYPHTNLIPEVIASVLDIIRPTFWLELGSMLGGSAIRVADMVKRRGEATDIVCIDPFTGDVNMWAWEQPSRQAGRWQFLRLERGRPTIYDRFMANVTAAGHGDIILPVAATSIVGMKLLRRLRAEGRISSLPSVIYLDSAHEPDETFLELQNCWALLPSGGVLMGDDWSWDAVRNDVLRFARSVPINHQQSHRLAARHRTFTERDGVLLDRGQWVLAK